MTKPYSEADFQAQLADDRTWRIKEISDLKSAIRVADAGSRRVLLRALIAICYAHWEGHVRFSAKKYMEHIALRRFQYDELSRQFRKNLFLPRLSALSKSDTSLLVKCDIIDEIIDAGTKRFSRVNEDLINTRANLNSEVIAEVCLVCGVEIQPFVDQQNFIDVILLKRRNAIAHGEEVLVDYTEMNDIAEKTVVIMRAFGDALENNVVLKTFKAA